METVMIGLVLTVLALAIPISVAEMFKRWVVYKEAELAARGTSAENRALEKRVQVLERIVTDRGLDVAAQIEALRDDHSLNGQGTGVPLNLAKEKA